MSAATTYFNDVDSRPFANKLASFVRVLADRYEAKTVLKSKAKRVQKIHRMAANYEAAQPNLAAELRFVAWSA